ncbi:MAG: RusA family crossover junction endodeoxyribonuclease [Janthinobacterium lividum]
MFPIEFTFEGPPLSLQSKKSSRKRAYKEMVEKAARAALPDDFLISSDKLEIKITYYFEGEAPDVDNIIKPIQDALIGVIYIDDKQIADTRSRQKDINGSYKIRNSSACLLQAFGCGKDFIHIKIDAHVVTQDLD